MLIGMLLIVSGIVGTKQLSFDPVDIIAIIIGFILGLLSSRLNND